MFFSVVGGGRRGRVMMVEKLLVREFNGGKGSCEWCFGCGDGMASACERGADDASCCGRYELDHVECVLMI